MRKHYNWTIDEELMEKLRAESKRVRLSQSRYVEVLLRLMFEERLRVIEKEDTVDMLVRQIKTGRN
jgi:hypothetical protein